MPSSRRRASPRAGSGRRELGERDLYYLLGVPCDDDGIMGPESLF